MNKREAKRKACYLVAAYIEGGLNVGHELFFEEEDPDDQDRIYDALRELSDELFRRGGA